MAKCTAILLLLCLAFTGRAQQLRFTMPLKGVNGKDFFICRYVDHDTTGGITDAWCGTQTYDGHKGTDMLLRNFKTMDSGVYVYAAADGRVFDIKDGYYDRMKTLDPQAGLNYIAILHKEKLCTYYYHLRKNSVLVKVGDSVKAGQPIAMVGSSGYSTSPHLHFEVIDSNRKVIDPFSGTCADQSASLWLQQPPYDTSVFMIEDGFVPYVPRLDSLQERYLVSDTFNIHTDTTVCYWVLMHGLRKGDKITAQWRSPGGKSWSSYSFYWQANKAYAYSWPYIKAPPFNGRWTGCFFVNDRLLATRSFYMRRK